ncbi:MAG: porphobilinogen synthase [Spirochaetes bacterium]|nr:porphobilinogen synthase [Spirochaetota bacterium]
MRLIHRPRRNRGSAAVRTLVAETIPDRKKLIMPHFLVEGEGVREEIPSMPGISRVSVDLLLGELESDLSLGIHSILLFGIPAHKDAVGSGAYDPRGIIQRGVREIKKRFPEILCITDVCLCEYTDHGHCGVVSEKGVQNDPSMDLIAKTALSHAEAGADIVAPSDMMDGRVEAIRRVLDDGGFSDLPIMSYAAKYASAFYGPFREAAGSAPRFGDRKSYQMDFRNAREALREVALDIEEGADIVMVKPALSYLDIISRVRDEVLLPLCAYNVSGEYSMVKLMGERGFANEQALVTEILTSIFRAGADMIISYHTRDVFRQELL